MRGPEHYAEAERLAQRADALLELAATQHGEESAVAGFHMAMAHAQVHATLAAAAAQALPTVIEFMGDSPLVTEWGRATGWIVPAEIVDDEDWSKTHCMKEHEFGKCGRMKGHDGKCDSEEMPF